MSTVYTKSKPPIKTTGIFFKNALTHVYDILKSSFSKGIGRYGIFHKKVYVSYRSTIVVRSVVRVITE